MLLDEPTLGLDVLGSQVIIEYIDLLRREGKAVILTTHHLDDAERLCTRFGLLHRGRLVIEGSLAELRARTACTSLIDMFLTLSKVGPALGAQHERCQDGHSSENIACPAAPFTGLSAQRCRPVR